MSALDDRQRWSLLSFHAIQPLMAELIERLWSPSFAVLRASVRARESAVHRLPVHARLAPLNGGIDWLARVLLVPVDERLRVLAPEEGRGFIVRIFGISGIQELFTR